MQLKKDQPAVIERRVANRAPAANPAPQQAAEEREHEPSAIVTVMGLLTKELSADVLQETRLRLKSLVTEMNDQKVCEKVLKRVVVSHCQALEARKTLLAQLPKPGQYENTLSSLITSLTSMLFSPDPLYQGGRKGSESLPERLELLSFTKEKGITFQHISTLGNDKDKPQYFTNGHVLFQNDHEIVVETESVGIPSDQLMCSRIRKNNGKHVDVLIVQFGEISRQSRGDNVTRYRDWFQDFETGWDILVTTHHGIPLAQLVNDSIDLQPREVFRIIQELVKGVSEIHTSGEMLGNLKSENVMVQVDETWKRVLSVKIDLLSAKAFDGRVNNDSHSNIFLAPELSHTNVSSKRGDVFSVGAIIKYLLGEYLHVDIGDILSSLVAENQNERLEDIKSYDLKLLKKHIKSQVGDRWKSPRSVSSDCIKYISKMTVLKKQLQDSEASISELNSVIERLKADLIKSSSGRNPNGVIGYSWKKRVQPQKMPYFTTSHSSGVYNSKVYFTGGAGHTAEQDSSSRKNLNIVQEYDIASNTWRILPQKMTIRRNSHASCVVDGKLYSIGGWNKKTDLSSVEVLDLERMSGGWTEKTGLIGEGRIFLTCDAIQHNIIITGGKTGEVSTAEVQIYNTAKDIWTLGAPLPTSRHAYSSVSIGTDIFVSGGCRRTTDNGYRGYLSNTTDKYDPYANKWTSMSSLPQNICTHASSVLDTNTFAISGGTIEIGGKSKISSVYLMDVRENKWNKLSCELKTPRKRHQQVTLNSKSFMVFGGCAGDTKKDLLNDVEVVDIRF